MNINRLGFLRNFSTFSMDNLGKRHTMYCVKYYIDMRVQGLSATETAAYFLQDLSGVLVIGHVKIINDSPGL
jgi:hypothetical protein